MKQVPRGRGARREWAVVPASIAEVRYPVRRTSGGTAVAVEITPRVIRDPVPIALVPGWGQTARSYAVPLRVFAERGRCVFSAVRTARGHVVQGRTALPREAVRKAQVLIGALTQAGHRRVDIVAHSEGALGAVVAAAHYPHRVRNMVLVDPGGLIANDRWHHLAGRFAAMLVQCVIEAASNAEERRALVWATINPTVYTVANPRRAAAQVQALAGWHSLDLLRGLRGAGVGIVVFEGVDNRIFPIRKAGPFVRDGLPLLDGFYAVRGGHAKLLGDARYAAAVLDALDLLRDRQAGGRNSPVPVTASQPATQ